MEVEELWGGKNAGNQLRKELFICIFCYVVENDISLYKWFLQRKSKERFYILFFLVGGCNDNLRCENTRSNRKASPRSSTRRWTLHPPIFLGWKKTLKLRERQHTQSDCNLETKMDMFISWKAFKFQNFWMVDSLIEVNYLKLTTDATNLLSLISIYPGWVQGQDLINSKTLASLEPRSGWKAGWSMTLRPSTSWSRLNISKISTGNSSFIACQFRNF